MGRLSRELYLQGGQLRRWLTSAASSSSARARGGQLRRWLTSAASSSSARARGGQLRRWLRPCEQISREGMGPHPGHGAGGGRPCEQISREGMGPHPGHGAGGGRPCEQISREIMGPHPGHGAGGGRPCEQISREGIGPHPGHGAGGGRAGDASRSSARESCRTPGPELAGGEREGGRRRRWHSVRRCRAKRKRAHRHLGRRCHEGHADTRVAGEGTPTLVWWVRRAGVASKRLRLVEGGLFVLACLGVATRRRVIMSDLFGLGCGATFRRAGVRRGCRASRAGGANRVMRDGRENMSRSRRFS